MRSPITCVAYVCSRSDDLIPTLCFSVHCAHPINLVYRHDQSGWLMALIESPDKKEVDEDEYDDEDDEWDVDDDGQYYDDDGDD